MLNLTQNSFFYLTQKSTDLHRLFIYNPYCWSWNSQTWLHSFARSCRLCRVLSSGGSTSEARALTCLNSVQTSILVLLWRTKVLVVATDAFIPRRRVDKIINKSHEMKRFSFSSTRFYTRFHTIHTSLPLVCHHPDGQH